MYPFHTTLSSSLNLTTHLSQESDFLVALLPIHTLIFFPPFVSLLPVRRDIRRLGEDRCQSKEVGEVLKGQKT